jgi:hypothetical protein
VLRRVEVGVAEEVLDVPNVRLPPQQQMDGDAVELILTDQAASWLAGTAEPQAARESE